MVLNGCNVVNDACQMALDIATQTFAQLANICTKPFNKYGKPQSQFVIPSGISIRGFPVSI